MDCEREGAPPAYITPTSTNTANATGNMPSKTNVYSQADGVVACLSKLFKLLRSIGGLIIILLVYTFLGAWIMVKLESPKEDAQKMEVSLPHAGNVSFITQSNDDCSCLRKKIVEKGKKMMTGEKKIYNNNKKPKNKNN